MIRVTVEIDTYAHPRRYRRVGEVLIRNLRDRDQNRTRKYEASVSRWGNVNVRLAMIVFELKKGKRFAPWELIWYAIMQATTDLVKKEEKDSD